jgi:hypothetical protein
MMGYGGFSNWQFGEILGYLGIWFCLPLAFRLSRKAPGHRLYSANNAALTLMAIFTFAMALVYIDSSKPLWDTRAALNDAFELFDEHSEATLIETNGYGPITVFGSRKPSNWPPTCADTPYSGHGVATFDRPIEVDDFRRLLEHLEASGYLVSRNLDSRGDDGNVISFGFTAAMGGTSLGAGTGTNRAANEVWIRVNDNCEDGVARRLANCGYCVDKFPDDLHIDRGTE